MSRYCAITKFLNDVFLYAGPGGIGKRVTRYKKGRSMKRQCSWFMLGMLVALTTPQLTQGMFGVGSKLVSKTAGETAEQAAARVAGKVAAELEGSLSSHIATEALEGSLKASMIKMTPQLERLGIKAGSGAAEEFMQRSIMESVEGIQKAAIAAGGKIDDKILAQTLTKNMSTSLKSLSKSVAKAEPAAALKELEQYGLKGSEATAVLSKMKNSETILGRASSSVSKASAKVSEAVPAAFSKTGLSATQKLERESLENLAKVGKLGEAEAAQLSHLKRLESTSPMGRFARSVGWKGVQGLGATAALMATAVGFMVPSLFQSAFLAEQQANALLATYAAPIQFGNLVLQLPDSAINLENPMASQFIYYGIPVSSPGEHLSKEAAAAYPGVSGPTMKNKISAGAKNSFAQMSSLGAAKAHPIPARYNLDAHAMATLPIFVSYTDQSWSSWGANGIPDAAFTQQLINLDTGYIFSADGTSNGAAPAQLIGTGAGTTVQSFLSTKYGQLKATGSTVTYTEFHNGFSGSRADRIETPLAARFNCSCLSKQKGVLSADILQACSTSKDTTCLLTKVLGQIAAGIVINADGKALQPGQDEATEVARGALGRVIPIQGLGSQFDAVLQMFPGAQQQALANSGTLTISLGSNLSASNPISIAGAEPDNYAAKGVYVYQCKNTPLAKILKSQSGGSKTTSYNDEITDFIVFLDANLNQVPLMTPVQDPTNYNFIKMGLNPAIKYVSTILGNLDSQGTFSFLPQLNIQSPPALIAKGLPASFPPLYGLQASNGSLTVNYNQNLTSAIGAIAQAVSGHAQLGQQFKTLQNAMLQLLVAGPFGKYQLMPVDKALQPNIGGVSLVLYTGYNAFPVSQDAANNACTDYLIPLSSDGKTVTLPSNNVAQYYGLVSDLTYQVNSDGTIVVANNSFENSILSQKVDPASKTIKWTINTSEKDTYYWMSKLTEMGQSSNPSFVMPQELVAAVQSARTAWITWIESVGKNSQTNPQFAGITIPGTSTVLTIVSQQALANGLYIYTCSPNPSSIAQDYFVLVNSSVPQANDISLGSISALGATATTNLLSIISGMVYTASGIPVKNSAGIAYSINPINVLQVLQASNPKGFSNDLKTRLNISAGKTTAALQAMEYPFNFSNLSLGMYKVDQNKGNYLYFDATGAGTSAQFMPNDYFVTVDSYTNPKILAAPLSGSTKYMVSLVSGKVYNPTHQVAVMPASQVASIIKSLSPQWNPSVVSQIATLTANLAAVQDALKQETSAMNAAVGENIGQVTMTKDAVMGVITSLASQDFLPNPYNMLKQDPSSGAYIIVSPASQDGTQFIYTFLDVENSYVDAKGRQRSVGAMYDGQGNLLRVIKGLELATLLREYGVVVDAAHKVQYLGAMNQQAVLLLDAADKGLKPGSSGKAMICSSHAAFPTRGIISPFVHQNNKYYFYYNTIMNSYYVMEVKGSSIRYVDLAGGAVYHVDGSSQIAPASEKSGMVSQDLQLLPIDMTTRKLLSTLPADSYGYARLILQNNVLNSVIFNGQLYSGAVPNEAKTGYTLQANGSSINVSMNLDTKTKVQYVEITADGQTYNYQYDFLVLQPEELQGYHDLIQKNIGVDIAGNVDLVSYLPVDDSGSLQLSAATMSNLVNPPSDKVAASSVASTIANILQDTVNNRFLVGVTAGTYSYMADNGYVDLENGLLFDSLGRSLGYSLQISDMMNLIAQLSVQVVSKNNKAMLSYHNNKVAPVARNVSAASGSSVAKTSQSNARSRVLGRLSSKKNNKKMKRKK